MASTSSSLSRREAEPESISDLEQARLGHQDAEGVSLSDLGHGEPESTGPALVHALYVGRGPGWDE